MTNHDKLVQIYRGYGGAPRFELLRSVLAGNDIDCVIHGGEISAAYPVNVGYLSEFVIFVREEDAEVATELLKEVEPDDQAEDQRGD
jgi:Putative prokaryotic signal transducing protein